MKLVKRGDKYGIVRGLFFKKYLNILALLRKNQVHWVNHTSENFDECWVDISSAHLAMEHHLIGSDEAV